MENNGWIKTLKTGNDIAIYREYGTGCAYTLAKVDGLTPNGDVVVDQIIFDSKSGKGKAGFEHYSIVSPTSEVLDCIEAYKFKMLIKGWASDASLKDLKSAWIFITTS